MNSSRRDFIKNTALVVAGSSLIAKKLICRA